MSENWNFVHTQYLHVTSDICVCVHMPLSIHMWMQLHIQIPIQIHSSLCIACACVHLCDRGVLVYLHGSLPHDSCIPYVDCLRVILQIWEITISQR